MCPIGWNRPIHWRIKFESKHSFDNLCGSQKSAIKNGSNYPNLKCPTGNVVNCNINMIEQIMMNIIEIMALIPSRLFTMT